MLQMKVQQFEPWVGILKLLSCKRCFCWEDGRGLWEMPGGQRIWILLTFGE